MSDGHSFRFSPLCGEILALLLSALKEPFQRLCPEAISSGMRVEVKAPRTWRCFGLEPVWPSGKAVNRLVSRRASVRFPPLRLSFLFENVCGFCGHALSCDFVPHS